MVLKRVICCLDIRDGRVVKGQSFVNLRDMGDPVERGQAYMQTGADELCFWTSPRRSKSVPCFLNLSNNYPACYLFRLRWAAAFDPLMMRGHCFERERTKWRSTLPPCKNPN